MDERVRYAQEAERLRQIMNEYHKEAMVNQTTVNEKFYVYMKQLGRVIKNYRAYCKRHNLPYGDHDI